MYISVFSNLTTTNQLVTPISPKFLTEYSIAGTLPPELLACRRRIRIDHQLPRVLHRAGRQQPGRRVPATAERDHSRLRRPAERTAVQGHR